jgi:hypothetical protein
MFRFSIRELMLIVAMAGVGLSCFLAWSRESEARRQIEAKMELLEQFVRLQKCSIDYDGTELLVKNSEIKYRATAEFIDITIDGQHCRIARGDPHFPKPPRQWEPSEE